MVVKKHRYENCQKSHAEAVPTYNFSFKAQDCTGSLMLSCLGESVESIMGMKCTEFYNIHEDVEAVKTLGVAAQWKQLKVTVRAKIDQSGYS